MDAKVVLTHVPYRGTALALNDPIGGNLQFLFDAPNTALLMVAGGQVARARDHRADPAWPVARGADGSRLFVTFAGGLAGPPVFALVIEARMGYDTAFTVVALPALLCGLALLRGARPAGD
jgi:hypothetical protein